MSNGEKRAPAGETAGGGGCCCLIFIVFFILKVSHSGDVASWSWWWVTAPLWGPSALVLGVLAVVCVCASVGGSLAASSQSYSAAGSDTSTRPLLSKEGWSAGTDNDVVSGFFYVHTRGRRPRQMPGSFRSRLGVGRLRVTPWQYCPELTPSWRSGRRDDLSAAVCALRASEGLRV